MKNMRWHIIGICALITACSLCGHFWRESRAARIEVVLLQKEIAAAQKAARAKDIALETLERAREENDGQKKAAEEALLELYESMSDLSDDDYFERVAGLLELAHGGERQRIGKTDDAAASPLRGLPEAESQ